MTNEQKTMLEALGAARSEADENLRNFGFINVGGRSLDELVEIGKRGAVLDGIAREARGRLEAFQRSLQREAELRLAKDLGDPFASMALRSEAIDQR